MLQLWLAAALAVPSVQNPVPIPQGPQAPVVKPGLAPQGGSDVNIASQPAMPPPLTPEQVAERLALQITGLSARIQSLRKSANVTASVDAASIPAPESRPSLDTLRTLLGETSRELQTRAHAVEVKVATERANEALLQRTFPLTGFMAAPEGKVSSTTAPIDAIVFPPFDASKAAEVVYTLGSTSITRGELEGMMAVVRPIMQEASMEQVASTVLRRALIQSAALRNAFPTQVVDTLKRAKDIHADVVAKKVAFEEAVKLFSEEAAVKAFGGLVDGAMAGGISDFELLAISKLKPGDVSEPFLANASVEVLQLLDVNPGATPAQTTYKFRRLVLGIDMGVPAQERFGKTAELVLKANVKVLNPAYEPFLPPSVQRTVVGPIPAK